MIARRVQMERDACSRRRSCGPGRVSDDGVDRGNPSLEGADKELGDRTGQAVVRNEPRDVYGKQK